MIQRFLIILWCKIHSQWRKFQSKCRIMLLRETIEWRWCQNQTWSSSPRWLSSTTGAVAVAEVWALLLIVIRWHNKLTHSTEKGKDQHTVPCCGSHTIHGGGGGRRDWSHGDLVTKAHPTVELQWSDHSPSQRNHLVVDDGLAHKKLNLIIGSLDVMNPQKSLTQVVGIDGTKAVALPVPPPLGYSLLSLSPPILSSLDPLGKKGHLGWWWTLLLLVQILMAMIS